uniref:CCZ1/INTU/HPS4 third Longin domain-containing protein n=1 Tax=Anopheles culicifacies TaxID=139723 RepID=A0A182MEP4_9DIPT
MKCTKATLHNVEGSTYFLSETLSKVRFISLQNGKFALRSHGRFMLAVGSDRNIAESILEYRASLLSSLIELYHGDFNTLYNVYVEKEQKTGFNEKVFCLMESTLPLLQFNGNILQNMPLLRLPKCASNVYLESNQILQSFLQNKGVLGGTIFYHNKVLASQLPTNLTKMFVYSDPYRMKLAEMIGVPFHVPNGVSLISAHITKRDYSQLVDATKNIPIYFNNCPTTAPTTGPVPFAIKKKLIPSKELGGTVAGFPMLKSDKSIIFSNIPEEDTVGAEGGVCEQTQKKTFNVVSRPTFLPLKFKNLTSRDIIDSGVNSINFDESDSFPNFIGKTSVCSTPLTENKIVPNRNIMSICVTQDQQPSAPPVEECGSNTDAPEDNNLPASQEANASILKCFNARKYSILNNTFMMPTNIRCASMSNLIEKQPGETEENSPEEGNNVEREMKNKYQHLFPKDYDSSKTINDPVYPIVDQRKRAMSYSLFQDFERTRNERIAELVEQEAKQETKGKDKSSKETQINSSAMDVRPVASKTGINAASKMMERSSEQSDTAKPATTPKDRRGLSLPIKSFNLNDEPPPARVASNGGTHVGQELFTRRKSTLELTPLMTKLTVLAMNDTESSGVSSWDTTPGCSYNMAISPQEYIPQRRKSQDISQSVAPSNGLPAVDEKALVKVDLFVCVQQNMTLILVMQEKNCKNQRLVQTLFESCVSKFLRIENDIQLAMNINVDGFDKADGYSLIALDSDWDVAKKNGPWNALELQTAESLHTFFRKSSLVTEVTLKSQETVLYGYQCGMRELFYTQTANAQGGLPPPQDVMGSVPLCAKRRIERDHFALLL